MKGPPAPAHSPRGVFVPKRSQMTAAEHSGPVLLTRLRVLSCAGPHGAPMAS